MAESSAVPALTNNSAGQGGLKSLALCAGPFPRFLSIQTVEMKRSSSATPNAPALIVIPLYSTRLIGTLALLLERGRRRRRGMRSHFFCGASRIETLLLCAAQWVRTLISIKQASFDVFASRAGVPRRLRGFAGRPS